MSALHPCDTATRCLLGFSLDAVSREFAREHSRSALEFRLRRKAVKKVLLLFACVIPGVLYAAVTLSAHHTWPVSNERPVTMRVVLDFAWTNPHPMMTLEVKNEAGQATAVRSGA